MAAVTLPSEKDLLCPQCSGIYCVPVLLSCGHNICRICLQKFWEWRGRRECPVCRIVSVPQRPPINLELKIAAEEYQEQKTNRDQVCPLHQEKLTIFCQNDEQLICLVCQMSKRHRIHECYPVEVASLQKKEEISTRLESMRKKLSVLIKTKEQWEDTKIFIQSQACKNEKTIKEEFEKLHGFLWEEEKARVKALRHEEDIRTKVMCDKLKNITDQIEKLFSNISGIEAALRAKDFPFLQDYKKTKKNVIINIQEPECLREILIDSARHLVSLKFEMWRKMASVVACVPFTLDPNTAHPNLALSEELTCVQSSSRQILPDNPERCTAHMSVLGATGFTSGKHSWTVEVGQGKEWYIGVATESIKRKSVVNLNPPEGFWVIGLCSGDCFWAQMSPPVKLVVKQKPARITIKLDFEKGKVVFINTADLTTMHTFNDKFTERIFPYFSPGLNQDGKDSSPLKVCPLKMTVETENAHTQ
ncbi:zinc-binding protein A33-like [Antennarius striatus]|uniref:zinc-binding protein A33-like n=1 Tax=Antennarius striatus TaxID=241820 RepID=UPI0035B0656A